MYAFVAMTKSPNAVSRSRRQLDLSSLVYRARSVQKAVPNESPAPIKTPTRGSHCVISMLGCSHSPRPLSRTVPKGGRSSASRTHRLYQVRSISRGEARCLRSWRGRSGRALGNRSRRWRATSMRAALGMRTHVTAIAPLRRLPHAPKLTELTAAVAGSRCRARWVHGFRNAFALISRFDIATGRG